MGVEVDLHLHTTASDGRLSPAELVRLVASCGLKQVAVSDHDSTEGLAEAFREAEQFDGLRIIPGIELSADIPGNEIHMLGYFINYEDQEFQDTLTRFRLGRIDRARGMVEKLAELGIVLDWELVQKIAGDGAVGRPHIALAMVEMGYCSQPKDAFPEYLGRNGLAYVERVKITPGDAVRMLRKAGGVPVLAHPAYTSDLESNMDELKDAGLLGMEVYYASFDQDTITRLERLADRYDLIPCGGSDYHGLGNVNEALPGVMGPPLSTVTRLEEAARNLTPARPD
jgi:predicted metal-dependent phosphoesterase TrpH